MDDLKTRMFFVPGLGLFPNEGGAKSAIRYEFKRYKRLKQAERADGYAERVCGTFPKKIYEYKLVRVERELSWPPDGECEP